MERADDKMEWEVLVSKKEETKCINIIKQFKND